MDCFQTDCQCCSRAVRLDVVILEDVRLDALLLEVDRLDALLQVVAHQVVLRVVLLVAFEDVGHLVDFDQEGDCSLAFLQRLKVLRLEDFIRQDFDHLDLDYSLVFVPCFGSGSVVVSGSLSY